MAKEKRTKSEVFGEVALDLGKLTFAGIVLATIFNSDINKIALGIFGFLASIVFVLAGVFWTTKK